MNDLLNILSSAIALLFTIIVHEVAHGYAALIFKDTTAKDMGRLSINPLKHLSLPGLISLYIFKFGWAKPVPVDFNRLRPRKLGFFVVSIAGIFTNLILCFISCLIFVKVNFSNGSFLYNLFLELILYNAGLAVFNLLPFPPLDGSKVILSFFPKNTQDYILRNEKFLYTILLILIFTGTISKVIQPITSKIIIFFINIVS